MKIRADRRIGLLLGAVLLLTFVAIGATVALPASDPSVQRAQPKLSAVEARGYRVFRRELCWYCATTYTGKSKGAPGAKLDVSSYAGRSPSVVGVDRVGPDLAVATSMSKADLIKYLKKPHGDTPSLAYLSAKDLDALASFLLSLK
jgi:hypothetical protein